MKKKEQAEGEEGEGAKREPGNTTESKLLSG